jgi:hypothetical protein
VTARRLATVVGGWEVFVWLIAAHHSSTAPGEMKGFLSAAWTQYATRTEGCYLLRTNIIDLDPAVLWKQAAARR